MVGKAGTGNGFRGLLDYLLAGADGQQHDRVEWLSVRNLATEDPALLPAILRSTAAQSERVEKPVYHLVISLDPNERVGPKAFEQIVERTLRDLQLEEHQAVLVAHRDTEHPHVHVMLNRVHPETRIAWDNRHDWARIERSLRHQERELGLREVPGRHYVLPGQERYREVGLSSGARLEAARTGEKPFGEQVRELARDSLRKAQTWDEVHRELAEVGLFLERRGRGLVISNGERRAKASFVDRKASRGALETRLGPFVDPPREFVASAPERWADVQGLRREMTDLTERYKKSEERRRQEQAERFDENRRREEIHRLEGRFRTSSAELDRRMVAVFEEPTKSRERLVQAINRDGLEPTLERLQRKPQRFGRLRGRGGLLTNAERWAARDQAGHVATAARDVAKISGRLEALRTPFERAVRDVSQPAEKGLGKAGRRLARSANHRVQRMGWQLAARVLPGAQLRVLRNVLKLGVGWNVPHLKVLALSLEVGQRIVKASFEVGRKR